MTEHDEFEEEARVHEMTLDNIIPAFHAFTPLVLLHKLRFRRHYKAVKTANDIARRARLEVQKEQTRLERELQIEIDEVSSNLESRGYDTDIKYKGKTRSNTPLQRGTITDQTFSKQDRTEEREPTEPIDRFLSKKFAWYRKMSGYD